MSRTKKIRVVGAKILKNKRSELVDKCVQDMREAKRNLKRAQLGDKYRPPLREIIPVDVPGKFISDYVFVMRELKKHFEHKELLKMVLMNGVEEEEKKEDNGTETSSTKRKREQDTDVKCAKKKRGQKSSRPPRPTSPHLKLLNMFVDQTYVKKNKWFTVYKSVMIDLLRKMAAKEYSTPQDCSQ